MMRQWRSRWISMAAALAVLSSFGVTPGYAENSTPAPADTIRLELEDYAAENGLDVVDQASASNHKIAKMSGAGLTEPTTFTVKVNVPETAQYKLAVGAGCKEYLVWLSPLSVSINGGAAESLTGYIKSDYTQDTSTFGTARFERKSAVELKAGENIITFTAGIRDAGGVYYSLDFLELERAEERTILPEDGRLETEYFAQDWGLEYVAVAGASHGAIAKKADKEAVEDSVSFTFEAQAAGAYVMAVGAGCEAWAAWLSPVSVSVNGGTAENLAAYRVTDVLSSGDGFRPARMTRLEPFELKAGTNQVTFSVTPRKEGGIFYSLDYVDFIKVQEGADIRELPSTGRIEAEDYAAAAGLEVNPLDVASRGANAVKKDASAVSDVCSIAFYADKKAAFVPSIGAACDAWAPWLSPLSVSINGSPKEKLNDYIKGPIQSGDHGFRCADLTRKSNVMLYAGLNVITFYAAPRSIENNGGIFYALDYIDFIEARDSLTNPEMSVPSEYGAGDTGKVIVMDGSQQITPSDVYQMTFSSTNERVATVSGEGVVTAKWAGSAEIKVGIRVNKNSDEVELKQPIKVTADGIYFTDQSNQNGVIKFTVNSDTALTNAAAVAASYEGDRMVDVKIVSIAELAEYSSCPVEAELNGYEAGQTVKIFLWEGINSMKPLCKYEVLEG